ncbi:MAG: PUA domain-containing protein [Nitrososphaerales archaeon]
MRKFAIDPRLKIAASIDAIFGSNVSSSVPIDKFDFIFSKRTGRIKNVLHEGNLVCTLRTDGGLALTIYGASLLIRGNNFMGNCVTVRNDVSEFISDGKSVFCKHVIRCGDNVRVGSDVAVLDEGGNVIAVGKAVLSARMMREFTRGVAVKVREGLKAGR